MGSMEHEDPLQGPTRAPTWLSCGRSPPPRPPQAGERRAAVNEGYLGTSEPSGTGNHKTVQ